MSDRGLRIGCGAGYSGDRIEPAVELATHGRLDWLVFECLAERTIAVAQQARAADPQRGYDDRLEERFTAVLPHCAAAGTRIVTNMGAANPLAAGERVQQIARDAGLHRLRIAVITGDDVLAEIRNGTFTDLDVDGPLRVDTIVSANAYLGAEPIAEAITAGAHVIITGRVADPSLFVAPMATHFGWSFDDWHHLGRATVVGHLLECAGQVTGGYFADPTAAGGRKTVAGLARLGFPLAEVAADGSAVITKVAGSGGCVTRATCSEQLLYELHDPSAYLTPDVIADFSQVRFADAGHDRVRVDGGDGRQRPTQLKVSVGCREGWMGEGQISYAGPGAVDRGRLAAAIVAERLELTGAQVDDIRFDVIGLNALHSMVVTTVTPGTTADVMPYEVRLRVAARTGTREMAERVAREVESLYTNGPAGGGGATMMVKPVLAMRSTLIPRDRVRPAVHMLEVP